MMGVVMADKRSQVLAANDVLTFSDGARTFTLKDLTNPVGPFGLDKRGLAAALNVSEQDISDWIAGASSPPSRIVDQLQRAVQANAAEYQILGPAWGGKRVIAPRFRWEPIFRPAGRFGLPFNVDWSGPPESRWRDARDSYDLDMAYMLIIDEGGVGDMIRFIDPSRLSQRISGIMINRYGREVWPRHLEHLGHLGAMSNVA
jgi:hypothetical protein